jgi:hypothetical protein
MSSRPWHTPQSAEVLPKRLSFRENVALAVGLAFVIVFIRLWRLVPK